MDKTQQTEIGPEQVGTNPHPEMREFAEKYPLMYKRFFEMNRAIGKLQREVDRLARQGTADARLGSLPDDEKDQRGPTLELD